MTKLLEQAIATLRDLPERDSNPGMDHHLPGPQALVREVFNLPPTQYAHCNFGMELHTVGVSKTERFAMLYRCAGRLGEHLNRSSAGEKAVVVVVLEHLLAVFQILEYRIGLSDSCESNTSPYQGRASFVRRTRRIAAPTAGHPSKSRRRVSHV